MLNMYKTENGYAKQQNPLVILLLRLCQSKLVFGIINRLGFLRCCAGDDSIKNMKYVVEVTMPFFRTLIWNAYFYQVC